MIKKIKFTLTDKVYKLMKDIGIDTEKELFNNAFILLQFIVKEARKGNKIVSVNKITNKYKELELPVFKKLFGKSEIFD